MSQGSGSTADSAQDSTRPWLQAELNRIWLMAELCLRHFQHAQLRPQPEHSSIAEIENIFAVRREARRNNSGGSPDVAELNQALAAEEKRLPALRQAAPIGRLASTLGLRPTELEVLTVAMAPHVDAPLAEVFQLLRGSQSRRGVDLALVALLFRKKRDARIYLLDALDPERPLLSWRLVQVLPSETPEAYGSVYYRAIQPTFDVLSVLFGRGELSSSLANYAELVSGDRSLSGLFLDEPLKQQIEVLFSRFSVAGLAPLEALHHALPWVVLFGARGAGKREVAKRAAAHANRPLLIFNPEPAEGPGFDEILRRAQREALLSGAILYVGPLRDAHLEDQGRALLRRFESYPSVVIFGIELTQPPRFKFHRALQEINLSFPSEMVRLAILQHLLPSEKLGPDVRLDWVARSFKLTPGEITETAQEGLALAALRPTGQVTHEDLKAAVNRRLRNDLAEIAQRITVVTRWKDLVLPAEDMFRIREFINRSLLAHQVYAEWGFEERIGYGKGLIALFSGPPGTGKTMLAGLIATEMGLDLYQVDLAKVVSKWVGETEKQLARVFDQAERAHAVLLFDEADALFSKRTEVKNSNDRYGNLAVNYLLQRLEQYSGVAVLTTNKEAALDEALQRRLTLHLHLEIPEEPERERLWRSFMPAKMRRSRDINFRALAKEYELSGGYIKNAAVRAAFLAAAEHSAVNMRLLRRAITLELEDQGKLVNAFARQREPATPE